MVEITGQKHSAYLDNIIRFLGNQSSGTQTVPLPAASHNALFDQVEPIFYKKAPDAKPKFLALIEQEASSLTATLRSDVATSLTFTALLQYPQINFQSFQYKTRCAARRHIPVVARVVQTAPSMERRKAVDPTTTEKQAGGKVATPNLGSLVQIVKPLPPKVQYPVSEIVLVESRPQTEQIRDPRPAFLHLRNSRLKPAVRQKENKSAHHYPTPTSNYDEQQQAFVEKLAQGLRMLNSSVQKSHAHLGNKLET